MKKKIVAIMLCVAMLATAIVGGTLAYFTDEHEQVNTFTAGKVGISLDEAIVKLDEDPDSDTFGDLIADGEDRTTDTTNIQNYHLFPDMTVTKDPTITVDAGSEDAYIAAKITITGDLLDLYGADTATPKTFYNLEINKFVSGGLIAPGATQALNWNGLPMVYQNNGMTIYQDAANGNNGPESEWIMYIFMDDVYEAGENIVLFDTLTIDAKFDNAEMAKLNGMTVTVEAFAVQENSFVDCFTAMTTAFPTDFAF